MVSRVTGDVDQISQFLQTGGVQLLLAGGQLIVSTVVMFAYSWQLTVVVLLAFGRVAATEEGLPQRLGPEAYAYHRMTLKEQYFSLYDRGGCFIDYDQRIGAYDFARCWPVAPPARRCTTTRPAARPSPAATNPNSGTRWSARKPSSSARPCWCAIPP